MQRSWPRFTLLPAAPFVLWCAYCYLLGERRWEHAAVVVLIPILAYASERTKRLYLGLLPFALTGLLYDAMRFVKNVGLDVARVHVCDLRAAELRIFRITEAGAAKTASDYFAQHGSPLLDLYCA